MKNGEDRGRWREKEKIDEGGEGRESEKQKGRERD